MLAAKVEPSHLLHCLVEDRLRIRFFFHCVVLTQVGHDVGKPLPCLASHQSLCVLDLLVPIVGGDILDQLVELDTPLHPLFRVAAFEKEATRLELIGIFVVWIKTNLDLLNLFVVIVVLWFLTMESNRTGLT